MSKKFTPPERFVKWTKEETESKINSVKEEIAILNQECDKINSKISGLIEEKMITRRKISNKHKYINQLKDQLKESETGCDFIEDGFGNRARSYCPDCNENTMIVVRPGYFKCSNCS